jgi:DNA invertase Pin-like site-specific DNA recombinase
MPPVFQKEMVLKPVPKPLFFIYSPLPFQNMSDIAVYARISTTQQDATRQVEDCRRVADRRDATAHLYVDRGISGGEFDRPEFQRLQQDIEDGTVETVLTTEASRIGRSFLKTAEFIQLCYDHGVKFEVLNGSFPTVDPDDEDEMAKKYAELMAWAADLERYFLRQRVQSGVNRAQRAGKWTGRPPYGFTVRDGYLVVEPEDYLRMQAALELVETDASASLTAVARHAGIPKSSLSRVRNDPEHRRLYLYGETADDRIESALVDADLGDEQRSELAELRDRIETLEAQQKRDSAR